MYNALYEYIYFLSHEIGSSNYMNPGYFTLAAIDLKP